jgi:hypothetical protein
MVMTHYGAGNTLVKKKKLSGTSQTASIPFLGLTRNSKLTHKLLKTTPNT